MSFITKFQVVPPCGGHRISRARLAVSSRFQVVPPCGGHHFDPDKWPGAENTYWKSLLRTMPTDKLEAFYRARLGEPEY